MAGCYWSSEELKTLLGTWVAANVYTSANERSYSQGVSGKVTTALCKQACLPMSLTSSVYPGCDQSRRLVLASLIEKIYACARLLVLTSLIDACARDESQ